MVSNEDRSERSLRVELKQVEARAVALREEINRRVLARLTAIDGVRLIACPS